MKCDMRKVHLFRSANGRAMCGHRPKLAARTVPLTSLPLAKRAFVAVCQECEARADEQENERLNRMLQRRIETHE